MLLEYYRRFRNLLMSRQNTISFRDLQQNWLEPKEVLLPLNPLFQLVLAMHFYLFTLPNMRLSL